RRSRVSELQLVEDLWDDLAAGPEAVPLRKWEKAHPARLLQPAEAWGPTGGCYQLSLGGRPRTNHGKSPSNRGILLGGRGAVKRLTPAFDNSWQIRLNVKRLTAWSSDGRRSKRSAHTSRSTDHAGALGTRRRHRRRGAPGTARSAARLERAHP